METNQLVVQSLAKQYHARQVVENVSLQLNSGEIVGLLGPNGAGKTTSFYMIVGFVKPDKGEIQLNNRTITHLPMHARARLGLGYLPQEPSIFRKLSVKDNILAALELNPRLNKEQRQERLMSLMDEFNLTALAAQKAVSLSGGERRRLEIARCLAVDPQFILLDEPFAGIDPISVTDAQRVIQQLSQRGIGILITDHNVEETLAICDRAYIVNQGHILCEGTPQEITANPQVQEVYLGEKHAD